MTWDLEVDVLAVGSGAGGVTAALTAATRGADALVIEKMDALGGVTAYSGGQIWMGATQMETALGIEDSDEATGAYLEHIGAGYSVQHMRKAYIEGGRAALAFLASVGVQLEIIRDLPDYFYPLAPGSLPEGRYIEIAPFRMDQLGDWECKISVSPNGLGILATVDWLGVAPQQMMETHAQRLANNERCSGTGLMASLIHAALGAGVQFRTQHACAALVRDGKRVVGAVVDTPEGQIRIGARKGVALGVGGYDWNARLVQTYEHLTHLGSMTPPTINGDHMITVGELGAAVESFPSWSSPYYLGFMVPGTTVHEGPKYQSLSTGQPHTIVVNQRGLRFGDESFTQDLEGAFAHFDGINREPVNWPAWLVFDESWRERFLDSGFKGTRIQSSLPADLVTASSIEELATKAGIDVDGLCDTVQRFNGFCVSGIDEDFGRGKIPHSRLLVGDSSIKPNPLLAPIDRSPFYAIKLVRIGFGVPSAGLVTNEVGKVMSLRGTPIEGCYALGNSAARLETGAGYNSGIANGRGVVFGFLAGRDATG